MNYMAHGIAKVPGQTEAADRRRVPRRRSDEDEPINQVHKGARGARRLLCTDLNKQGPGRGGSIRLIGRQAEIERTIQVLCRRTKNNPLYVGDAGVGDSVIFLVYFI